MFYAHGSDHSQHIYTPFPTFWHRCHCSAVCFCHSLPFWDCSVVVNKELLHSFSWLDSIVLHGGNSIFFFFTCPLLMDICLFPSCTYNKHEHVCGVGWVKDHVNSDSSFRIDFHRGGTDWTWLSVMNQPYSCRKFFLGGCLDFTGASPMGRTSFSY